METPLVTIGVTCFNAEDTIGRAVASALHQDWPNFEMLIVDDMSSDGSIEAVESASAGDPKVRLIRHEKNIGPAGSRNTLLKEAKGGFLVFFDDDDKSSPNRISVQLRTLNNHEAETRATLVACYAGGIRRYPNGYIKDLPAIGSRREEIPFGPGVADYLLFYSKRRDWFYGAGVPACALMARLSTFKTVGGFDPSFRRVEDVDFAIRLAMSGGHFVGTSEQLYIQYSTAGADKSPEKNLESEQLLAVKNRPYLDNLGRYYYALHWPKLRYWHFKRRYGRFVLELLGLIFRHPFAVSTHLFTTGPARLRHESKMQRKQIA